MFDVHAVAKHFKVSRENVLSWIAAGDLAAVNVSPAKSKRKMWRVSQEAINEFERKRSNRPSSNAIPSAIKMEPKRYF